MPTYDYLCRACGKALEIYQSITESPKRKCPECGKLKLERQIGAGAGFLFKGSGFYQTDYRSQSYSEAAKAERGAAAPDKPADASAPADAAKAGQSKSAEPAAPKPAPKPPPGPDGKRSGGR